MIDGSVRATKEYLPSPLIEINTVVRYIMMKMLQICIIYYVPSIHNIHQDKMQKLQLGFISLHVSAVTGHLQANYEYIKVQKK